MEGGEPKGQDASVVPETDVALAVVVVTLSAGGLTALRSLVSSLHADLPAAVVIAQHIGNHTILPSLLDPGSRLPVMVIEAGTLLRAGTVYVCPPLKHVMVNPDVTVGLSDRERNPFRPSGNWLFESAAAVFDERVVAVVLSGGKDDGARGVLRVRARGGKVIVQDPSTCTHPEMPRAAIATGTVDFIAAPEELGTVVMEYVSRFDLTEGRERWEDPFSS